ncbi:MAG: CoA ester lyase [Alphaproteobacteria bacterium]|nr:CoA ester lyase [Alphaproteobacteria bacterium]
MPQRLRLCRSILFLPASNPRAIEKARALKPDMVVLDLEDAVKPADKEEARHAAVAAAAEGFGESLCAVRLNAVGSAWFGADAIAMRRCKADYVVLPRVASRQDLHDAGRIAEHPMLAMIETAAGVLHAADIARDASALIAGTNDLAADLGLRPGPHNRPALRTALQTVVLAARAAGIACFDGVYNRLEADAGLVQECEEGRSFGFDGKSLIHPSQIDAANRAFGPTEDEIAAAERLIAAASGGAERHGGEMIERMHVDQARFLLARARR